MLDYEKELSKPRNSVCVASVGLVLLMKNLPSRGQNGAFFNAVNDHERLWLLSL